MYLLDKLEEIDLIFAIDLKALSQIISEGAGVVYFDELKMKIFEDCVKKYQKNDPHIFENGIRFDAYHKLYKLWWLIKSGKVRIESKKGKNVSEIIIDELELTEEALKWEDDERGRRSQRGKYLLH